MPSPSMASNCARLGARALLRSLLLAWDERYALLTVVIAAFGRAISEVGAVMIVGGNMDGFTRVMTTAIALETSKGDLPLALGLGLILLAGGAAAQYVGQRPARALARTAQEGGGRRAARQPWADAMNAAVATWRQPSVRFSGVTGRRASRPYTEIESGHWCQVNAWRWWAPTAAAKARCCGVLARPGTTKRPGGLCWAALTLRQAMLFQRRAPVAPVGTGQCCAGALVGWAQL